MGVLESLSASFSKKARPGSIEALSHWLMNHEAVYGQQILEETLGAVLKDAAAFERLLPHQRTTEVCSRAVSINGHVVRYLTDAQRTPEVCLAAVRQAGRAIEHLTDAQRTPEVCLAAVRQAGRAIWCLTYEQLTSEVCLAAVQQDKVAVCNLSAADCAKPLISDWIIANWDQCASILGAEGAAEVARAILRASEPDAQMERARG